MRKNMKLQSAMEYLMTYGWAILIIAVVMVALFALGVFNGQSTTACVQAPGYLCQAPIYSHTTGNIVVTVGQTTGVNWVSANFFYVPQGTPVNAQGVPQSIGTGVPDGCLDGVAQGSAGGCTTDVSPAAPNGNSVLNGLISGQTSTLTFPVIAWSGSAATWSAPVTAGASSSGTIWAVYTTTSTNPTPYYVQVATVTLKAV